MKTEDLPYIQPHISIFEHIFDSDIKKWPGFVQSVNVLFGFIALNMVFYLFSFLINNDLDWRILLYLNPDSPVPVFDDLMIFVTDFSMALFGLVFIFWEIGCQISKHFRVDRKTIAAGMKIIGAALSIFIGSAHFWAGYAHSTIFFPLAVIQFSAFWFMGSRINHIDDAAIDRFNRLFWLTGLAVLMAQISVEVLKEAVARPRPLSGDYVLYAQGIRTVADEVVRGGYSYVAGHSAAFFAMVMPLFFFTSKKWLRAGLILWALVHAFSRVYLAAHFPYCSLMGAALGFSMGTLVFKTFGAVERAPWISESMQEET